MPFLSSRLLSRNESAPKRHRTDASMRWGWLALVASAHATGLGLLLDHPALTPPAAAPILQVRLLAAPPPAPRKLTPERSPLTRQPVKADPPRRPPAPRTATVSPALPAATAPVQAITAAAQAQTHDAGLPPRSASAAGSAAGQDVGAAPPLPHREAEYLDNPAPAYPGLARRLGEEGTVVLRVHVLRDGRAREIEILTPSGSPRLDQAASAAVRHWRFLPARLGEERIDSWLRVPVVFRLEH